MVLKFNRSNPSQETDPFLSEITNQSIRPPGGDVYIASCYQALLDFYTHEERLKSLISQVKTKRSITPEYFANLLFRAIQFIEINEFANPSFPHKLANSKSWAKELAHIFDRRLDMLTEILLTRNTTTTKYQRYIGTKAILNALFPNENLVVADFGCGGNYGLRGLSLNLPFEELVDHTPGKLIEKLASHPLTLKLGWAIDRENPDDPEVILWRRACQFYPSEFGELPKVLEFERQVALADKILFQQSDIRSWSNGHVPTLIPKASCDAVIISTTLYQMPADQEVIIYAARKILKKRGVVIVQDFAQKSKDKKHELEFVSDWFKPYSYRTFIYSESTRWLPWDVLRWKGPRCSEVRPGEEFEKFTSMFKLPGQSDIKI
ncbi:MAG: hypothetical protein UY21_C0003G0003 [Microgenomates group bacterium GW2011_GWA1_48_10]|nr:MAG: hypothetical protein UY21_C0003G0003 [Microgenomates group bacterium GW2011_GWA1_48_10]